MVQAASVSGETFDLRAGLRAAGAQGQCVDCGPGAHVEAFLISTGVVALAEIGDKTQLLALVLACRFRKPVPIVVGLLCATLLNHALAGIAGRAVANLVAPNVLRWILGVSFIVMAAWMLVPDRLEPEKERTPRFGPFLTTLVAFFLLEMGDKTQIATVALAAKYSSLTGVVAGTTLGMLIANAPVVFLGNTLANRLPLRVVHAIAACIFILMGVMVLLTSASS
jgi:putative Ca2+/H+ antiporter (TMEM165/GDT1 family)